MGGVGGSLLRTLRDFELVANEAVDGVRSSPIGLQCGRAEWSTVTLRINYQYQYPCPTLPRPAPSARPGPCGRVRRAAAAAISPMADDNHIPSISSGVVGSRFVSQSDIDSAKARRDEQWKAAYARYAPVTAPVCRPRLTAPHRLGQEPPPQPQEDVYDGRSLAEVCPPFYPSPPPPPHPDTDGPPNTPAQRVPPPLLTETGS